MAGQSNMDGMGYNSKLPDELNTRQEETYIYNPNRKDDGQSPEDLGQWTVLEPGHGYGHRFIGDRGQERSIISNRFGPELTFAKRLKELRPSVNIALFKYARGGSSIHPGTTDDWGCWDPGYEKINQWTHFKHHYRRSTAIDDIDGDGGKEMLKPSGIIWMQGESDAAYSREIAEAYAANLKRVIHRIRQLTGNVTLPVVIGRISGAGRENSGVPALPWADIVQQAQADFVNQDENAALVSLPDDHGWLDPWHYDSTTYLELGIRFAEAVERLLEAN